MKRIVNISILTMIVSMISCVNLTVNIHFPTTEIKEAANVIEERVRSGQGAEGLETSFIPTSPQNRSTYITFSFGKTAYAQALDISKKTPMIAKIIDSRTKRYKTELESLMDKGIIGEGHDAFLDIRDKTGLDLKSLRKVNDLIKAENNDRTLLYKEILSANGVEINDENLGKVQDLFVIAIQNKLKPGQWYAVKKSPQSKDVEWIQKKKK
jgi:hypothetical protein